MIRITKSVYISTMTETGDLGGKGSAGDKFLYSSSSHHHIGGSEYYQNINVKLKIDNG
jgi:predicted chitinase